MSTYQEELANLISMQEVMGGYVYESGAGECVWSMEPMSEEEQHEHWDYVRSHAHYFEHYEENSEPFYTLGGYPRYYSGF